jgi:two-component system, NarL family, response regulator
MSEARKIRLLLADDHPVVRAGLVALISRRPDMEVIAEANTGREALGQFLRHSPDVSLVDLRMPDMDGVDAILAIRVRVPDARIILLTTYDGDDDIYRGLRAGAKAYMLKDAPPEELVEGIRAVYEGRTWLPQRVAAKLATRVSGAALTSRELEVLRLVVAGKINKEIGDDLGVTEGTVKVHVNHILAKLGVSGRTEAVSVALKRGLVRL